MNAKQLVAKLLEGSPYDVDDPLEKSEIPAGFTASRGNERIEWHYDPQGKCYRFSKFWPDDFTGKPRVLDKGMLNPVTLSSAAQWLHQEMNRWREGGWEVEEL